MPDYISGLEYGCISGFLLILAWVIYMVLAVLFKWPAPQRHNRDGTVIGERLSERSAEYWHAKQAQARLDEMRDGRYEA